MPDIDAWMGDEFPLGPWEDDTDQGVDTARILADKSVSVVLIRAGVALDAQDVRVEDLRDRPRSFQTEAGITGLAEVLILGYFGHPTITDTDIQRGDRFALAGVMHRVVAVAPGLQYSVQAFATVRS